MHDSVHCLLAICIVLPLSPLPNLGNMRRRSFIFKNKLFRVQVYEEMPEFRGLEC